MIDLVTRDVHGLIWLTDKPLKDIPQHFEDMDYLFDGLISMQLSSQASASSTFEKNVYSGQSFGHELVLVHICSQDKALIEKEMGQLISLIPHKEEHHEILVFGENKNLFPDKILKKKAGHKFRLL